jgi:hypothetical protein
VSRHLNWYVYLLRFLAFFLINSIHAATFAVLYEMTDRIKGANDAVPQMHFPIPNCPPKGLSLLDTGPGRQPHVD